MNNRTHSLHFHALVRGSLLSLVVLGLGTVSPELARAADPPSKDACVSSHEAGQNERNLGQLLKAREALRQCSNATCPTLIAGDCTRWLEELQRLIPTILFEAQRDGKDVVDVKVREGDRVLTESITGTSLELDPGVHKFTAETPGEPPMEVTYVLREGEKNRVVRFEFSKPEPVSNAPLPNQPDEITGPRPIPFTTYLFGGLAIASAGAGAVFGTMAMQEKDDLDALGCKPNCPDSKAEPTKNNALIADVGFGVAVVSAGLATIFYVTRPVVPETKPEAESEARRPRFSADITPDKVGFGLSGAF